jgi:phosphoglucosamine mutase
MGRYFGTDGYRGVANESLSVVHAFKIGEACGELAMSQSRKIVLGQDTRISSPLLANAFKAGCMSRGCDVYDLKVTSTPCVAHHVTKDDYYFGVMISASHNPYMDNGIKIFNHEGIKIQDELEGYIEDVCDGVISLSPPQSTLIGRDHDFSVGVDDYIHYLVSTITHRQDVKKVVIDCAHGSTTATAQKAFEACGFDVVVINNQPNGTNINDHCGSTHPQMLQSEVVAQQAFCGFAYDGDGDRLIAVDEHGRIVDGDQIMYALGKHLMAHQKLHNNVIIATVMSNLGFIKACEHVGINVIQTQVGDKYVFAKMRETHASLGGEQSGHLILPDLLPSGDGVLASLQLMEMLLESKQSLSSAVSLCRPFPQLLRNLRVKDKQITMNAPYLKALIEQVESQLIGDGRVLVRASGTENLVRVMVEASTQEKCEWYVNHIIEGIEAQERN